MAVVLIPNQTVKLYKTETFNQRNKKLTQDYRTYCQIVKEEQTTMFQVKVTPEGNELLTNGDFASDLSGWSYSTPQWQYSSGQAQAIVGFAGYTDLSQSLNLSTNTTYALTIDIALFSGSQNFYLNFFVFNGEQHGIQISRDEFGSTPGVFTVYFNSGVYTHHEIRIVAVGAIGDLAYVNFVSLYKLTEPTVTLDDCDGNTVRTLTPFARGQDRITYSIEWFGLNDDCYRICLTGVDDTELNYLDNALALATEGDEPIELEDGGNLKWFG